MTRQPSAESDVASFGQELQQSALQQFKKTDMPQPDASTFLLSGLSQAEAHARLVAEGFNELPASSRRTPLRIALEVMREPMLALLLGGGTVYLLLGDLQEALILLAFATLSVGITIVQEARTERVLGVA